MTKLNIIYTIVGNENLHNYTLGEVNQNSGSFSI